MKIAAINQTHTTIRARELYNIMKIQTLLVGDVWTLFCTDIHTSDPIAFP